MCKYLNFCYWPLSKCILYFIFINAAAESVQTKKQIDPCTPRGYKYDKLSEGLSPSSILENRRYSPDLHPSGNFSECRSASLKLLQKGKGMFIIFPTLYLV